MLFYALILIILCFGFVIIFGAPYLPTLKKQSYQALDLLQLKPGQTFLDLGSGDGRLLVWAAKNNLNAIGIELNPILFLISRIVTFRYRKQVKVIYGNFWPQSWPQVDGIYIFLHPRFMTKFLSKLKKEYSNSEVKVVSYAFKIPGVKIEKESGALYYYEFKQRPKLLK